MRPPAGPAGDLYVVEIRAPNQYYVVNAITHALVRGPFGNRITAQDAADRLQGQTFSRFRRY
jgi:hypothetical protein